MYFQMRRYIKLIRLCLKIIIDYLILDILDMSVNIRKKENLSFLLFEINFIEKMN